MHIQSRLRKQQTASLFSAFVCGMHDMICLTGTCWQERFVSGHEAQLAADFGQVYTMDVATCQQFACVGTENAIQLQITVQEHS